VKTSRLSYVASIAVVAALAGCGSSSSSSSSATSSAPAAASASSSASTSSSQSASPSLYGNASTTPASSAPAAHAALITTKHAKIGTVLAYGPERLTVYLFEADKGGMSHCNGACAKVWPPVIGTPHAAGQAQASELGTIKRSDGTVQVTYKGHPLYRFIKDKDDGDTYGEGVDGFGAEWYALAPSGKKIDNS
jgi:predicted lipoprotein with Yx(FWY)xxD motif